MQPEKGKRVPSAERSREGRGTCEELGAARKNPPVYGDRHVKTVMFGTRETLPHTTARCRKEQTYKPYPVKWRAVGRESEGAVVPVKQGQHNLVEGRASKDNTPLRSWESRR
jgi:hypothetical protein